VRVGPAIPRGASGSLRAGGSGPRGGLLTRRSRLNGRLKPCPGYQAGLGRNSASARAGEPDDAAGRMRSRPIYRAVLAKLARRLPAEVIANKEIEGIPLRHSFAHFLRRRGQRRACAAAVGHDAEQSGQRTRDTRRAGEWDDAAGGGRCSLSRGTERAHTRTRPARLVYDAEQLGHRAGDTRGTGRRNGAAGGGGQTRYGRLLLCVALFAEHKCPARPGAGRF
jgi:hypothetical protein